MTTSFIRARSREIVDVFVCIPRWLFIYDVANYTGSAAAAAIVCNCPASNISSSSSIQHERDWRNCLFVAKGNVVVVASTTTCCLLKYQSTRAVWQFSTCVWTKIPATFIYIAHFDCLSSTRWAISLWLTGSLIKIRNLLITLSQRNIVIRSAMRISGVYFAYLLHRRRR